uniref:Hexosyltransferase n=1 Tax=Pyramimonas obovata TaxID=1411642 RepID=A0A7S0MZI9_9CHLO|mmetsp:Transcript_17197/g.37398  ORF Transcript_17197/g.37398 Transcript_17197/m.37398 type:complete len:464 (+) Transcript_17197:162-1553(+)
MRQFRKAFNRFRFKVLTSEFRERYLYTLLGSFLAVLTWTFITGFLLVPDETDHLRESFEQNKVLQDVLASSGGVLSSPGIDLGYKDADCKACKPGETLGQGLVRPPITANVDMPIGGSPSIIGSAPSIVGGAPSIVSSSHAAPIKSKNSGTKSITDSCTQKTYTCDPTNDKDVAYVYFLNNARGTTVKPWHAQEDLVNLTYFDYTYASVSRLASLTSFPIYILATKSVSEEDLMEYKKISSQVRVRVVTTKYDKLDIKTDKPYHFHTFGKFEVFNPENTDGKKFLAFMDSDTYALHNVDELFCLPKEFAASKRDKVPVALKSAFNSGTFVYTPNAKMYQGLLDDIVANAGTVWQNGEQSILNRRFGQTMNCLPVGYNCVGFGAHGATAKSDKCSIKGPSDEEVWKKRQVMHVKLSDKRFAAALPTIAESWRSYLPKYTPPSPMSEALNVAQPHSVSSRRLLNV